MIGEPVAVEGAFLDLGAALVERLAHLLGHQPGEARPCACAQDFRGLVDHGRALGEAPCGATRETPARAAAAAAHASSIAVRVITLAPAHRSPGLRSAAWLTVVGGRVSLSLLSHERTPPGAPRPVGPQRSPRRIAPRRAARRDLGTDTEDLSVEVQVENAALCGLRADERRCASRSDCARSAARACRADRAGARRRGYRNLPRTRATRIERRSMPSMRWCSSTIRH